MVTMQTHPFNVVTIASNTNLVNMIFARRMQTWHVAAGPLASATLCVRKIRLRLSVQLLHLLQCQVVHSMTGFGLAIRS